MGALKLGWESTTPVKTASWQTEEFSDMITFPGINIKGWHQVLQSRYPDLEKYIHEQEKGWRCGQEMYKISQFLNIRFKHPSPASKCTVMNFQAV